MAWTVRRRGFQFGELDCGSDVHGESVGSLKLFQSVFSFFLFQIFDIFLIQKTLILSLIQVRENLYSGFDAHFVFLFSY